MLYFTRIHSVDSHGIGVDGHEVIFERVSRGQLVDSVLGQRARHQSLQVSRGVAQGGEAVLDTHGGHHLGRYCVDTVGILGR